MKSRVRNFLMTAFASLTAASLGLSFISCKAPEESSVASSGGNRVYDVTDALGAQLDTSEFMNSDLIDQTAVRTKSDGSRRVIVELESDSLLDVYLGDALMQRRYGELTDYVNAAEGREYASTLTAEQNAFISALSRSVIDYEVRHVYTSIINGISLEIDDSDVAALEKMDGVRNVIYSESYAAPQAEATINDVKVYSTGIYDSTEIEEKYGYSGKGMAVAVLDTGFDRSHPAFQEMPAEQDQKFSKDDIASKFNDLAAPSHGDAITLNDVYYNEKVPFAYDYADGDADVFPKSSSHGNHVAGIIAGHEEGLTAADGEAFENNSEFRGVAPDAQLVICKVFPDQEDGLTDGGAETDDLLAAVSDCVTLGVDVINMSLGTSAGFSREADGNAINEVYDKVYDAGVNLVVAASNSGSSAQNGAYGSTNLTSNPDSGTVGSPSTYAGALSVASISGQMSSYLELDDGTAVYFSESSTAAGEPGDFVDELLDNVFGGADSGTLKFIVVPGYGNQTSYTSSIQNQLANEKCIVVVSRGSNSFEEKQRIAFDFGAVGCIIYNNLSGKISASLGTGKKIPTCTVTADIGQILVEKGSGTLHLDRSYKAGPFMSEFSAWGPTSDLKIKPEITAHGGEITSAVVGGYSIFSGTSMASPNMAGAVALLRQHVSESYELTGTALSDRVNALLMSTATIVRDERGLPYAVRRQGAGLGDIGKAISSDAYIYVENSSKPKLELGDDPNKTGIYTMEFHVSNMSRNTKTYQLGAIVMTESVSIDEMTVAEQSYMLDDAKKTFYVNGQPSNGTVTLGAEEDVTVGVTIELTAEQKDYLDKSFENGMYVEGFITLDDADEQGVDLSVPYLAFYGDWLDAPIFDKTAYEVSADKHNSAIEDEDKAVAAVYESVAIGRYYKGMEIYIPLGQYVYDTEGDVDSGIESKVDKIAIGNSEYGIYEFYAVYFGMLRSVEEMDVVVTDSVTGEVVWSKEINMISKSYSTSPSYADLGISPYELGLNNNTQYTATFTTHTSYNGRQSEEQTQVFTFYVDYEAPIIYETDYVVRYTYDTLDPTVRHVWLDLYIYDNHYSQAVQLFTYAEAESDVDWATDEVGTLDWLTEYSIPVEDGVRNSVSKVTIEITDWMDNLISMEGEEDKYIGVRVDDYALNSAAYMIAIPEPEVSSVGIDYSYPGGEGSLSDVTLVLEAGEALDFTEDNADIILPSGDRIRGAEFDLDLNNYGVYSCAHTMPSGAACSFVYDEHVGYTYQAGDYYYDEADGKVKQKTAADTSPSFPAGTLLKDMAAAESGSGYESRHFVCPECGTEITFTYNSRTEVFSFDNFTRLNPEAMSEEVIWQSSDESVVRVWNGRLYAVAAGTATISAYAPDAAEYPYPMDADPYKPFTFTVQVEGEAAAQSFSGISVDYYENLTLGTTRGAVNGSVSVPNGTKLVLHAKISPWYYEGMPKINWTSQYNDVVYIPPEEVDVQNGTATVYCLKPGTSVITMQSGLKSGTFTITVGEQFVLTSTYFYEYNGPGYTEHITVDGAERDVLVVPANLGITNFGSMLGTTEGPFYENDDLDIVVVPEGVTSIGQQTFENSTIRRIYLPSTLNTLAYNAFAGCEYLEEVYWYDASEDSTSGIVYNADTNSYNWDVFLSAATEKITSQSLVIGSDAFRDCVRLKVADLKKATALYDYAFRGCVSLTGTVDLGDIRYSGYGAFDGCSGITGVVLGPNTVLGAYMFRGTAISDIDYYGSYIGNYVFSGMTSLESVTFHDAAGNFSTLTGIGTGAFSGCTALSSVDFGDRKFTSVGSSAFAGCTALESVELPATASSLGNYAFQNCTSLAEVVLDGTTKLQSIGSDLFRGCSKLNSIKLNCADSDSAYYCTVTTASGSYVSDKDGNAVLVPPAYAVEDSAQTLTIGAGQTVIGAQAYANNASLAGKTLVIADSVREIGAAAFAGTGITAVIIPSSVTTIGSDAFAYCSSLQSVVFLGDISVIPEGLFRSCGSLKTVQIPDSVTEIGAHAFSGTGLRYLEIGRNVQTIGEGAFADSALAYLEFAQSGRLREIGDGAFENCGDLVSVVLPEGLETIGADAFRNNSALAEVSIPSTVTDMGDHAFADCSSLTSVTIADGVQAVGNYAFAMTQGNEIIYAGRLDSVVVPDSVKRIGDYAFAGNAYLESISLPGVEEIGDYAFFRTRALADVTLSAAARSVGVSAFEDGGVKNIDLSGVEYFAARSFYGTPVTCNNFAEAVEIGDYAFYNCSAITGTLRLPSAVTIGERAFGVPLQSEGGSSRAGAITAVELGDGLVSLGGGAFYNSGIRRISLPASLESIGTPAFASCSNLIVITVDSANEHFFADYVSGGLYRYLPNGTYELVAVPNGIDLSDVDDDPFRILEGTSRVGDWAMAYCESIHSVVIPASVRTIGSYAFYYMGMGNINDQGMTGSAVDRKYYPKYIFEGLQAPTLEAEYTSEEAASFTSMYFNFSYQIGYLVNDMVIPVNAKGFDSVLYEFFFMNTEYSEEKIEDNTQSLIDDLAALDVEALTAADAERVQSLNTTYLMLTDGQKAFVAEEYYNKLMQAVSRIDELTGGDTPSGDDGNTPSAGGEGSSCQNAGLIGGICGGVGGLLIAAAAIVAVMVVRRKKSSRASQGDDAAQDNENLSGTDEKNKEEDDDE